MTNPVTPAEAGVPLLLFAPCLSGIPAFAGMTKFPSQPERLT
jgi:hypothetical protein